MSESLGFSLLPGTANAGNASMAAGHVSSPLSNTGGAAGGADASLLHFNVQSTRRTVEILQAQMQLLGMRVETLEKQNAFLFAILQQQQQQQQTGHGNASTAAANSSAASSTHIAAGATAHNGTGGTSPFLPPRQPQHLADSPSAAAKQLEDDLQRLRLAPAAAAAQTTGAHNPLNSPPQPLPLADGYNGANALLAAQQQQLATAMAHHQREEAIMQMLQGQSSPTAATPTTAFPMGFPMAAPGGAGGGSTANGGVHNGPAVASPDPNGPMAGMAYLYTPTSHGAPPAGSPNAQLPSLHAAAAGMMLHQQHSGAGVGAPPPMFAMNGGAGGMFGFGGGAGAGLAGGGGAGGLPMGPGGAGSAASLATTVTLDPNKSNNNDSLDRVCQQPWLKELIMKNCKSISNFAPIAKLRNLWKLNLQGCSQHVDDSVVKLISQHNKRLSRLNLCGCEKINNATALMHLNFLFDLNLSGCNIGNDTLEAVATGCQQLSRLAINSCPLITDISSLRQLKELKLLYCRYSGHISPTSIVQVLHQIGGGLLTLNVDGVKFAQLPNLSGADGAAGSSLPMPLALKNLNMKDNTELASLAWLTGLPNVRKHFAHLEMLDVEGCSGLAELGNLAVFPSLKFLRLSKTSITQESLEKIVAKCPSTTTLYLDGCTQIKSVESLTKMSSLRKVIVDPALNAIPAAANGLAALYQTNHVEVVFASFNNNNNSGGGGGHHHGGGGGTSVSPSGSPTSNFVPAMPTGERKQSCNQ